MQAMMTREQRERANRLVETLLDVAPERRQSTLESIVESLGDGGDEIRREVERLLKDDDAVVERLATLGPMIEANTRIAGVTRTAGNRSLAEVRDHVPSVIGRYHLRGPLGNGGMGVVYLAEQRAPIARTVAIKLVRAGFDTHEVIARFEAERQALARMDHAHIARVFDAGMTDAGRPYFVMEYVPGVAITDYADKERLNIRARLELFAQVCDALNHAHMKGVIHRDLKPSNVLAFTGEDGKAVVKVIDFGIAKALTPGDRLGKTTHFTVPNLVLGTYEYMSPEQAAGNADIDTRSDVYSLGVLLYELLSGLKPFERAKLSGQTDEELRRLIRDVEPPRPSTRLLTLMRPRTVGDRLAVPADGTVGAHDDEQKTPASIATARQSELRSLVRTLQRELEWIPMMAMRKDRSRRYGSAAELAADVRNCLAGLPLVAAPESKLYRARKFVIGHRRSITLIVAVLALLVAGVIGTGIGFVRESAARKLADANGRLASRAAYRSAIAAADVALRTGDGVSLHWALESAPAELRGWEWSWLDRSGDSTIVELHRKPGERYRWTLAVPDNRRAWSMSTGKDFCQLWDLQSGEPIRREPGSEVAVAPDGKTYAILRPDGTLEVDDTDSGAPVWRASASADRPWRLASSAFSLDGKTLAAWDKTDAITLFDTATGRARRMPVGAPLEAVHGFVDYGRTDGTASHSINYIIENSMARLAIDIDTGAISQSQRYDWLLGRRPLNNSSLNQARTVGANEVKFNIPQKLISSTIAYLPDSGLLAAPMDNGSVLINGVQPAIVPGEPTSRGAPEPRRLIVGTAPVLTLTSTPDERRLIATMFDGSVHACPVDMPGQVSAPQGTLMSSEVSPDGGKIATIGWGDARCFDLATGLPIWSRNLGPYGNRYLAWSPDGTRLAIASDPIPPGPDAPAGAIALHDFFLLDARNGEQLAAFSASPVTLDPDRPLASPAWSRGLRGLTFSADGSQLLLATPDREPRRIDLASWKPTESSAPTTMPAAAVSAITASRASGKLIRSPRGTRLAELLCGDTNLAGHIDTSIAVRDAKTLLVTRRFAIDGGYATAVAWAADEKRIFTAFARPDAAFVIAYDAQTGAERFRVPTPDGSPVSAIAVAPDGSRVIAFTRSRRMLVIDAETGDGLLASETPRVVLSATMAADQSLIVSDDGNAFVRYEARDPESLLSNVLAQWPASLTRPATIAEARRMAWKANRAVDAAQRLGLDPSDPAVAMKIEPDDAAARAALVECARRSVANLNALNSGALLIMLTDKPSAADLDQAATMLKLSSSLKPQSATLQGNYGAALFGLERYEACRAPLRAAIAIRAQRGIPQDPSACLRLAIAAHHCGDADAAALRDQALSLAKAESPDDIELKELIVRLNQEFGS
jgi:serine/threonine protein kinase/WD40 repeat protein